MSTASFRAFPGFYRFARPRRRRKRLTRVDVNVFIDPVPTEPKGVHVKSIGIRAAAAAAIVASVLVGAIGAGAAPRPLEPTTRFFVPAPNKASQAQVAALLAQQNKADANRIRAVVDVATRSGSRAALPPRSSATRR